jgi:hypothetical protein
MIRFSHLRAALGALVLGTALVFPGLHLAQTLTPQAAHAAGASPAQLLSFAGGWHNINATTQNITNLSISYLAQYGYDKVYVSGKCSPTDCNWGGAILDASPYPALIARYQFSFATKTLYLHLDGARLQVYTFVHFIDHSGRADYGTWDTFSR